MNMGAHNAGFITYVAIFTPIGPGVDSETAIISASWPDVNHPVFSDIS